MSVPKQRHSKGRRDRKRVIHAMIATPTQACSKCGKPSLSHRACSHCGHYKGREVISTTVKTPKKQK